MTMTTSSSSGLLFKNATQVAEAISRGGREGSLHSVDWPDSPALFDPAAKPNPELLFAGAYAACFHSAMIAVAKKQGNPLSDSVLHARVGQAENAAGDNRLVVELRAKLPGVSAGRGRELMEAAHLLCPYSKALRGEATVALVVD